MSAVLIPLHRPTEAEQVVEAAVEAIDNARAALARLPDTVDRHIVGVELDRILTLMAYGPPEDLI